MIVLLDTNQDHDEAAAELGVECGELLTPLTRRRWRGKRYGIDNGAFSNFDAKGFVGLLGRMQPHRDSCLFVACPDVVGSAMRTLELFDHWKSKLAGWPLAFVIQDGIEYVRIPWDEISAVFIGGSTHFKMGSHAAAVVKVAKMLGKWVHVGRVNTPGRYDWFEAMEADSCDGTGISRYSWMRKDIAAGLPLLHEKTA